MKLILINLMALKEYDKKKHQFWFDLNGLMNCVINENVMTPNSRSQDQKIWRWKMRRLRKWENILNN